MNRTQCSARELQQSPRRRLVESCKEGATLCAAGIVLGIVGATVLTRWLSSELHGISPTDPATYGAVAVVMSLVTLMACYVPTRRAMGVDPLIVLRDQ